MCSKRLVMGRSLFEQQFFVFHKKLATRKFDPKLEIHDSERLTLRSCLEPQSLRRSIHKIDEHHLHSLLTTIRDTLDETTFSYGAGLKSGFDVLSPSFADPGPQHCEFGPLHGNTFFARKPLLDDAEGVTYLMPKTTDQDIDDVASWRMNDIEALRNDPEWTKHVEFIGRDCSRQESPKPGSIKCNLREL